MRLGGRDLPWCVLLVWSRPGQTRLPLFNVRDRESAGWPAQQLEYSALHVPKQAVLASLWRDLAATAADPAPAAPPLPTPLPTPTPIRPFLLQA